METSEPVTIESFSYRWLINLKPSFESLEKTLRDSFDASDESSFIEIDPRLTLSKRFLGDAHEFNFDVPISQSTFSLVHADELFSNGLLMPLFLNSSKKLEANNTENSESSLPFPPISSDSSRILNLSIPIPFDFIRKCRRSSKKMFRKYLGFLRPLYKKVQISKLGNNRGVVEAIDERARVVKSFGRSQSQQTSPRISYSTEDWYEIECSISEAVLYCKKSVGTGRDRCFTA